MSTTSLAGPAPRTHTAAPLRPGRPTPHHTAAIPRAERRRRHRAALAGVAAYGTGLALGFAMAAAALGGGGRPHLTASLVCLGVAAIARSLVRAGGDEGRGGADVTPR